MIIGDVLLDVFILSLTIIFLYYNIVAQNNFLESYKIVIEDPDPVCDGNAQNLPPVDIDDLKKCENQGDEENYVYQVTEDNLIFKVTTIPEKAGNFASVCSVYCPSENLSETGCNQRESKSTIPYENCINLLDPNSDCANSSAPLAYDGEKNKYIWAVKGLLEPNC